MGALSADENHKPSQSSNMETWPCPPLTAASPSLLAAGLGVCSVRIYLIFGPIRLVTLQAGGDPCDGVNG